MNLAPEKNDLPTDFDDTLEDDFRTLDEVFKESEEDLDNPVDNVVSSEKPEE